MRGESGAGDEEALVRARALVLQYGWNATAYQIINPGIALWFAARGDAVVGFVRRHGVRVVAGAPVCHRDRLGEVAEEFERDARRAGDRVCYFGAGERLQEVYSGDPAHSLVGLGAQPSWNPRAWAAIIARRASLRAQLNRARNKGVSIARWPARRAHRDPSLRRCLDEWLDTRGLPPLHFLVEPETLERLFDRELFVAERAGRPVGFLVASPIPARRGWLIEQIVRGRGAPNGTAELLIDAAMRAVAVEGAEYVTLGLAPLSRHSRFGDARSPAWLRLLLRWVRAHGRRFYNFEGLDAFKSKFEPQAWEEIVAISYGRRFPPRALYAIAAAFGGRSPVTLLAKAVWKGARQEARWMRARIEHGGR
ncbi:MAG TPA: DUF2156 domain-containing protein [Gemmatimonadaceae bacterium]|nr:DUF2156 domain-containing protein [Gemmatimonadaceae bacterium]